MTKTDNRQATTYTYDEVGNLLAVSSPGVEIQYLIDARGRRLGKMVGGTLVGGLLWENDLRPAARLDANGALVSRFVYASGANAPDYIISGGSRYRIVKNHLGSPRLVVDTTSGALVQRIDYNEFGQVLSDSSPGLQPFGLAGGLYDPDTELVRFGARDYAVKIARWTVTDPLGFAGGQTNLYRHVRDDPVNEIDVDGLDVYRCYREAEIALGLVNHEWIQTDTIEAGMGPADGHVPGDRSDMPFDPVQVTNHQGQSERSGATCELVTDVDEDAVNRQLQIGRSLGRWSPTNQCQSFVQEVLYNATIGRPPWPTVDTGKPQDPKQWARW